MPHAATPSPLVSTRTNPMIMYVQIMMNMHADIMICAPNMYAPVLRRVHSLHTQPPQRPQVSRRAAREWSRAQLHARKRGTRQDAPVLARHS